MAASQATTIDTLSDGGDSSNNAQACITVDSADNGPKGLTLDRFPGVYVLPTHMSEDEIHELEELLAAVGARLVRHAAEAGLIISALTAPRRAKFELQARGIATVVIGGTKVLGDSQASVHPPAPPTKRQRLNEHTADDADGSEDANTLPGSATKGHRVKSPIALSPHTSTDDGQDLLEGVLRVVRTEWLYDSNVAGKPLCTSPYVIYEGRQTKAAPTTSAAKGSIRTAESTLVPRNKNVIEGTQRLTSREGRKDRNATAAAKDLAGRSFMPSGMSSVGSKRPLLHESTTEHDENVSLPDMPDWVIQNKIYSCERATPLNSPNTPFAELLKRIRLARILVGDEIGVRAYSSSIASILAYPYLLSSAKELMLLPSCDRKVAQLLQEYLETTHVKAADDVENDPALTVLNSFYNIWGVGATTAREFYYDRGWRDHDDIIEYGWTTLNRHQQIGLKYFDEFEQKMSRSEVDLIASIVTYHARQLVDDDMQCVVVGGHRRGKKESGDVDLILSHPKEENTSYLVSRLVRALEESGWITHTLILSEANSTRNQETLPLKSLETRKSGFDTLDKALVVWQDPNWTSREADLAANPKARNPNIHRRVDIIISPWRTVGCAVAGWTSGTTFQRDLRRYSRRVKGWKYDSSGVRDVGTGQWVDLEQWTSEKTRATSWQQAEKRVFQGLGLTWREPTDRNTA